MLNEARHGLRNRYLGAETVALLTLAGLGSVLVKDTFSDESPPARPATPPPEIIILTGSPQREIPVVIPRGLIEQAAKSSITNHPFVEK
jgi:hypothetical protein